MQDPRTSLAFIALGLALGACGDTSGRLSDMTTSVRRLCDAGNGVINVPAAQVFDQEERVCYAYRTVNDHPLHWTDIDTIRGEGRFGRTFSVEATRIEANDVVIAFFDQSYACVETERLVLARDTGAEDLSNGESSCYWRVGTEDQVQQALARSQLQLDARLHPPPPVEPRPRPPRITYPGP